MPNLITFLDIISMCKSHGIQFSVRYDETMDAVIVKMIRGNALIEDAFDLDCMQQSDVWNLSVMRRLVEMITQLKAREKTMSEPTIKAMCKRCGGIFEAYKNSRDFDGKYTCPDCKIRATCCSGLTGN